MPNKHIKDFLSANSLNLSTASILTIVNGELKRFTGATIVIDSSGNVGIGVTSPISSLHLKHATPTSKITLEDSSTNRVGQIAGGSDGSGGFLTLSAGNNGGTITERLRINSSGQVGIGSTAPNAKLFVSVGTSPNMAQLLVGYLDGSENYYDANTHYFRNGSASEVMRINSSGNIGIGQNSGGYRLSIAGNSTVVGVGILLNDTNASGRSYTIRSDAGTLAIYDSNAGADRLRIDSSGNVGIGVTPSSGFRFTSKGATATSAGYNLLCQNSSGSTCLSTRDDGLITTGLLANSPFNYTTAGAANAAIFSDGNLGRSTSSIKYKKDVVNTNHGLLEVMKLRPVTYRGKSENDGNTVFGGLIAEEVHDAGLTEFVQYADDGTPDALSYGNMVSLAFKAIQELKAEIDILKNK